MTVWNYTKTCKICGSTPKVLRALAQRSLYANLTYDGSLPGIRQERNPVVTLEATESTWSSIVECKQICLCAIKAIDSSVAVETQDNGNSSPIDNPIQIEDVGISFLIKQSCLMSTSKKLWSLQKRLSSCLLWRDHSWMEVSHRSADKDAVIPIFSRLGLEGIAHNLAEGRTRFLVRSSHCPSSFPFRHLCDWGYLHVSSLVFRRRRAVTICWRMSARKSTNKQKQLYVERKMCREVWGNRDFWSEGRSAREGSLAWKDS